MLFLIIVQKTKKRNRPRKFSAVGPLEFPKKNKISTFPLKKFKFIYLQLALEKIVIQEPKLKVSHLISQITLS